MNLRRLKSSLLRGASDRALANIGYGCFRRTLVASAAIWDASSVPFGCNSWSRSVNRSEFYGLAADALHFYGPHNYSD